MFSVSRLSLDIVIDSLCGSTNLQEAGSFVKIKHANSLCAKCYENVDLGRLGGRGKGGGVVLRYMGHRYVLPLKGMVFHPFWS